MLIYSLHLAMKREIYMKSAQASIWFRDAYLK